jgi:rhodanese-related sulfurtransferase
MARLVERDAIEEMVRQGAQLIEVLPAEEYAEEHLPGAVSHPLRQLDEEAGEIDRNRPVIVYCWDSA